METGSETYDIYFDEKLASVIMKWEGYATSAQFREGTELMLNTLMKNNASKVLGDIKGMVLIGMEDQEWLHTNFLPRAIQFGFKVMAIVKPDNYFNKVAVETICYKVNKEKLTIHFFDDIEDAKNWLGGI